MTFRYIGSKMRLADALSDHIGVPGNDSGRFVDAFCGTGSVAEVANKLGWPLWLNDHLQSATLMASSRFISKREISFEHLGGYSKTLDYLNSLPLVKGFVWREYSPASYGFIGIERRYFTEENAGKIDAIRRQVQEWHEDGCITDTEKRLLISDLLSSVNRVANTAGTYGCFLSKWTGQAQNSLLLVPRLLNLSCNNVKSTNLDVYDLEIDKNDLVYLDPPYTKRQYASYYHLLETVTIGDNPCVEGVAGLRPWKEKSSVFCYKRKALKALTSLVTKLNSNKILLSYSSEGHVEIDDLYNSLEDVGDISVYPLKSIGRYRPNVAATAGNDTVSEFLFVINKYNECATLKGEYYGSSKASGTRAVAVS